MTECILHLYGKRALPATGDPLPTDKLRLSIDGGREGTLLVGGMRFSLGADGALLSAESLPCGTHTPLITVEGVRYEGPPLAVFGGTLFFLPPTYKSLCEAEARIEALRQASEAQQKRLAAIERRMQDTHIF